MFSYYLQSVLMYKNVIYDVTPRTIRIKGCNLVKFNRDGNASKVNGLINWFISPIEQ